MPAEESLAETNEGLPAEAFAIVGNPDDRETWKLPHHKKSIFRALRGKLSLEKTVDWTAMPAAVVALSPGRHGGQRLTTDPEKIIKAARHLASHYQKAAKRLPDILAALV